MFGTRRPEVLSCPVTRKINITRLLDIFGEVGRKDQVSHSSVSIKSLKGFDCYFIWEYERIKVTGYFVFTIKYRMNLRSQEQTITSSDKTHPSYAPSYKTTQSAECLKLQSGGPFKNRCNNHIFRNCRTFEISKFYNTYFTMTIFQKLELV